LLDGIADGGAELATAAALALSETLHAFGVVELPLITTDGAFKTDKWSPCVRGALERVADTYRIDLT
jgi:hypothetical protein